MTQSGQKLPSNIEYVTYTNKERDAVNAAIFRKIIGHDDTKGIMVLSDALGMKMHKDDKYRMLKNCEIFWKACGESDIKFENNTSIRLDPLLKLYHGCPVMLTENMDVTNYLANGTQATIEKIVLHSGVKPFFILVDHSQIPVKAVFASQIKHVMLSLPNGKTTNLSAKKFSNFTVQFESQIIGKKAYRRMTANQLPFVVINCSTGHKLLGSTTDNIFINAFSYQTNWPYVAMSRVRTLNGLFLREPLKNIPDKYTVDHDLLRMTKLFRERESVFSSLQTS